LIAEPSTFGSTTKAICSSALSSRFRMSSSHFCSASSVVTFSSEPIGVRWRAFWNFSESGAPTRCVGESGVMSDGSAASSAFSSS